MQRMDAFLKALATPGSRIGGGSVAALSAAASAALLEKLVSGSQQGRRLSAVRRECSQLIFRDAEVFSGVVDALRKKDRAGFAAALKRSNAVQWRVFQHAAHLERACEATKDRINPAYRSDLICAYAAAKASALAAEALILANASWLGSPSYLSASRKRLDRVRKNVAYAHGKAKQR